MWGILEPGIQDSIPGVTLSSKVCVFKDNAEGMMALADDRH